MRQQLDGSPSDGHGSAATPITPHCGACREAGACGYVITSGPAAAADARCGRQDGPSRQPRRQCPDRGARSPRRTGRGARPPAAPGPQQASHSGLPSSECHAALIDPGMLPTMLQQCATVHAQHSWTGSAVKVEAPLPPRFPLPRSIGVWGPNAPCGRRRCGRCRRPALRGSRPCCPS